MTSHITRRALGAALLIAIPLGALAGEIKNPMQASATWDALKVDVVGDAELLDGSAYLSIDAPYRAHDAAIVPVDVRAAGPDAPQFTKLILVVDENPAPVVAEFELGPAMGQLDMSTRVRVNAYSNVRAIAVTADGAHYMVGRYVKASGGCSAPALKDADAAIAAMGKMKLRLFDELAASAGIETAGSAPAAASTPRREAQVMIRHPNYSGLQMNQVTRLFIPAHFVDELEVTQGEDLVFRMTAGISISEDPAFRFGYDDNGAGVLNVRARDTEGAVFERSFPIADKAS